MKVKITKSQLKAEIKITFRVRGEIDEDGRFK